MAPRSLPFISLKQFYKYLARYVRFHPSSARIIPPAKQIRAPTQPGVGLFFYPPDQWKKTAVFAAGPLGETYQTFHPSKFQLFRPVGVEQSDQNAHVCYWGVGDALKVTKNLASGVTEGFAVNLELHGVGYRAEAVPDQNKLVLRLGFSHVVEHPLDDGDVFINVINPQLIQVAGINRSKVHQTAATIRSFRPPEPYKGKGIRYKSEPVRRKQTKKD
ncbi:Ribosomal protein L6 [Gracilaria domingensis]|nr:Ribosomal protein L6 [Gracilaria domingensis]